ncbi:stage III sporulation protein AD [uncultured Clostridium sp.]|uniref:stage III sporulation protein AD n=1 Tax=uncultured Clostridium sp. TaxID=59620 RepID=UPI0025F41DD5|nr:stage III sporulation protein AD [uncultured Clostridium sp.]
MLILKIVGMAFVAMFIIVIIRKSGSNIGTLLELVAGALIFFVIFDPLKEIITFLQTISDKANIDMVYIGIVLKIIGIAYIASFASTLCKDANVDSLASQIDFAGKIMILVLAIPILMAVLNSILQIM